KKTSSTIGRLPNYRGQASPVTGVVQDPQAGIQVPRPGGDWRLDERPTVKGTYGYDTRQYAMVGDDLAAQVMTGPLPEKFAGRYTSPDDLEPVIKAVVVDARKRLYSDGNKVRKIAQQPLKVGDSTGRLIAYSLTSPTEKATIVPAAINTGGDLPAIVFMSVPAEGKSLLPDVNTVVKRLRLLQGRAPSEDALHVLDAVDEGGVQPVRLVTFDAGDAPQQFAEHHRDLAARQVGAEAEVRPGPAEAYVRVGLASDVEPLGVVEHRGV